jgi:uncharacterized Zn-binding protein involved in type VI secretion
MMSAPPEGARKSGKFLAICITPDLCWTPTGDGRQIVPYMIVSDLSASMSCSPNVLFTKEPAFLFSDSFAPHVTGNEPACSDGGKLSHVKNGIVWADGHTSSVLINGIPAVRHGDHCWMNSSG